jgi:hypothetical protein
MFQKPAKACWSLSVLDAAECRQWSEETSICSFQSDFLTQKLW